MPEARTLAHLVAQADSARRDGERLREVIAELDQLWADVGEIMEDLAADIADVDAALAGR